MSLALAACGGPEAKPPGGAASDPTESSTVAGGPATSRIRTLILGTSLTAGLGLDPEAAYPALLQHLADSAGLSVEIVPAGLSGETSAGALRRVEWLLKEKYEVVVIETGANDGLRALDPDSSKANIAGIVAKLRTANPSVRVLLAQMEAPRNLGAVYTSAFHDVYMNVARDEAVTLIPFFLNGVAGVDSLNQADGIHPNEAGARIAARNMWRTLAPVLRDTPGAIKR